MVFGVAVPGVRLYGALTSAAVELMYGATISTSFGRSVSLMIGAVER